MIKRIGWLSILVVVCFTGSFSAAENLEFSGYVQPELKLKIKSPYAFSEMRSDFMDLNIISHIGTKTAVNINPHVLMCVSSNTVEMEFDLKEAYVDIYSELCDIRFGKQIIIWGACNQNNAVDVLNPSDYRDPIKNKVDRKTGLLSLKADFHLPGDFTLETVFIPFFESSIFPEAGSQWYQGQTLPSAVLPEKKFSNSEIGLRLVNSISECDLAITYFNGWEDIPSELGGYCRTQVIAADFEGGIGTIGINTEFAYFITEDLAKEDSSLKNPYFQWILEFNHEFPYSILGGLQYSRQFGTGQEDIPDLHAGLGMDLGFFTTHAIGVVKQKAFGDANNKIELTAFYDIEKGGYFANPQFVLSPSDGVNCYIGMNMFGGGKKDSVLKTYSDNSAIYARIKYSF